MTQANASVTVGTVEFANDKPLSLIAGPCQLEGRQHAFDMAGALKEMTASYGIGLVYKSSYDKANRTSLAATRGAGLEAAMPVFDDLRAEFGVPILTDVHTEEQCALVAPHVVLRVATLVGTHHCRILLHLVGAVLECLLLGQQITLPRGKFILE